MGLSKDLYGNPVTLADASALGVMNDFVGGLLAQESRAVRILTEGEVDAAPLPQAYAAALHMLGETGDAAQHAQPYVTRALHSPVTATAQEQRMVRAIAAWVGGDASRCIALLEEQVYQHPRDLLALKLAIYHLFNQGDLPQILRLCLVAYKASADVPQMHGLLAFAWEECHFMREAESAAQQALKMQRKEPWAQHALAHIMLTEGHHVEGLAFMQEHSDTWTGLNSFMLTHNWWHMALFALALRDHAQALRIYDEQVWGGDKTYSQDQANAVSLLSRIEMTGVDVGARWQDVAGYLLKRTQEQVAPFLDLHYLYGLARAGRVEADVLMQHIRVRAEAGLGVWRSVVVPAGVGLLAHARGDYTVTWRHLEQALPGLQAIGGSHAQRGWFSLLYAHALQAK